MLKPDTLSFTLLLAMLTAFGPISTDMYLPSLPEIGVIFKTDAASVQLTLSVFLFGFAIGQLTYGPIADRFGRKPVMLAGLAIYVVAGLICAAAPTIETLIVARFFQAFGAAGAIVLARAVVRDVYAGNRAGRELARIGSIMGLVPAVAPTIGGVLHVAFGWASTFLATTFFGLLAAALVFFRLPETLPQNGRGEFSVGSILADFRLLAGHAGFRAHVVIVALSFGGLFAFISGSSFVLQNLYGLSELLYGLAFGVCALAYVAGAFFGQRLVSGRGYARTIGIGAVFLAAGGALMLVGVSAGPGQPMEIIGPMMIYMVGIGIGLPQAMAGALMPFPERAGSASSLMGFTQVTYAAVVGIFVGHMVGSSALPLVLTIAASGFAALAIYLASGRARAT